MLLERIDGGMWIGNRSRTDRILAAVEIPALGLWFGALCGFAFIQAPTAFAIVAPLDVMKFAALTSANLAILAKLAYVCGAIAIAITIVRTIKAGDRVFDFSRIVLVLIALVLVTVHSLAIVPAMALIPDVHSAAYHAMHTQSSAVYGGVVLCVFAALVMAAVRPEN